MSPQPAKPSKPKSPLRPPIDRGRGTLAIKDASVTGWLTIDKSGLWVHAVEDVPEGTARSVISVPTHLVDGIKWEAPEADETGEQRSAAATSARRPFVETT